MDKSALSPRLCIFEDERYPNFFPLSLSRPVFDLGIGTHGLRARLVDEVSPESLMLLCRPYLAAVVAEEHGRDSRCETRVNEVVDGEVLFLNGRLLTYGSELTELCASLEGEGVLEKNGILVAARLSGERAASFAAYISLSLANEGVEKAVHEIKRAAVQEPKRGHRGGDDGKDASRSRALNKWAQQNGVKLQETNTRLIAHYWQLIGENRSCIVDDFRKMPMRGIAPETELFRGVELINENDIVIGANAEVRSGTVLDASEGAIVIANGVRIEPNAIICGPCSIGESTLIRGGATIRHGTTLGRQCKVGGEVEECIFASYSNKQHEGFMGHSYVGSWVNIGAGSCTSDLKNNYGLIRAWIAGRMRDTGRRFLGATIGDHSKIAINSRLSAGAVVGFNASVVCVGFPPKFVPSFAWKLEPEVMRCELEAAIETAKIMMDRRNVSYTEAQEELFRTIDRYSRLSENTL